MNELFKKGDQVRVMYDVGVSGVISKGDVYNIVDVSHEGLIQVTRGGDWYYPRRFELVSTARTGQQVEDWAYARPAATARATVAKGNSAPDVPESWDYGRITIPQELIVDPGKPFSDPAMEKEKSAQDKLREYRRSLRDMLGQG